ncbi:hypothetical protein F4804DRAFT_46400 [Jackrogersella minutella]|nr:hypothetical protein F4804DRAFT_46400 [Jackrogersella minutella]
MAYPQFDTSPAALKSLFHHVALPAMLPQGSESNTDEIGRAFLDRLIVASQIMGNIQDGVCQQVWQSLSRSLAVSNILNVDGKLERNQLAMHLKELRNSDVLILHVATQNAGVLIHKPVDPGFSGNVLFETFEASPKRESVLASQTLSWTFPGTAVLVPSSTFYSDTFLENLAIFLEQASTESTQKFSEFATKAGHQVVEDRENPDPALITSFLTAILESNGKRISPTLLRKRVRDDVCWLNSGSPWRRLPYWLVLRVGIARYLATMLGGPHGRIQYKFLMCVIHGMILNDTQDIIFLEDQAFLKAKLCRRLYKLDRDHLGQPEVVQKSYVKLDKALTPQFTRIIGATTTRIDTAWHKTKQEMEKIIPPLPRKARPDELRLSLLSSREYITKARQRFQSALPQMSAQPHMAFQKPKLHAQTVRNKLLELFDKEKQIRCHVPHKPKEIFEIQSSLSARVRQLHQIILDYIDQIGNQYDDNAEQKSVMLLTLMETWVGLDEAACSMFPLLYDFHPVFTGRLMEALRLPLPDDILRARKVEAYIQTRISRCRGSRATLFDDPRKGCFAERYFDESPGSGALANVLNQIQASSADRREMKEQEWREMSAEYERLTRQYDSSTCIYIQSINGSPPTHDSHYCSKCQLGYKRSRMTIKAFEAPLPESIVMTKAIVFELRCPEALASYRDATWAILYGVARQKQEPGLEPRLCLQDYSELQQYAKVPGHISLASTTKSFLMTHYKERKRFPVDLDQVCLPNGLKLAYFDDVSQSWPGRMEARPTFEHHCKLTLPRTSPFSSLLEARSFNVYGDGPSSYEIAASCSSCPSSLNTHEYMAFQYLLSGKRRRWIAILTELGSSNLNLSTETTVLLFDHLVHQIGPPDEHQELGTIHYVFRDISFCEALLQQLRTKLEAIASNWRETHLMEIVIMLTLRLVAFTAPFSDTAHLMAKALGLLLEARQVALQWVRMLRKEVYRASGLQNVQNCQSYLLWAALLCKRTFACHQMGSSQILEEDGLSTLIECSVTVHDNIPENVASLGRIVRNSFVRDLRMMHDLKDQIQQSIELHGKLSLLVALPILWPPADSKSIYAITFEADNWLQIGLSDPHGGSDVVNYNYILGILLVNGQSLGRLPTDPKSTIILEELFGSQTSLMKYPSSSPGMAYVLVLEREGYHIHIGYDNGMTIIHAIKGAQTLELIPREVFYNGNAFDLPAHLVDNCIHWLDLGSGIIEIRQKSRNIWKSHPYNWRIDVTTSVCSRVTPAARVKETLVDPYSPLFNRVSKIFAWFEHPRYLTIYQPGGTFSSTIEMPRMQLKWFVNKSNLLQSTHLQAEIDPCQCIGTWYGFESKLVCRSVKDPQERFILVLLGGILARKRGCHLQVHAQMHDNPSAIYIRFKVNKVLGRIDCAPEPALVYKKAEIHAFTSFILPDPLTGLTGVESSLQILTSGMSQPWSPLGMLPTKILVNISRLSPRREYYPETLKVMKKEIWTQKLPVATQREDFHILVDRIISQSTSLAAFHPQKTESAELSPPSDAHLNYRGLRRRQLYERCNDYGLQLGTTEDTLYEARHDPRATSLRYANVLETVCIIRNKPMFMSTIGDLALNLSQSLKIKGYGQELEKISLHDRLDVDIRQEWGPLVNAVKEIKDPYKLMFFTGIISFRSNVSMPLIRTLIAFARWDLLQSLPFPSHSEYYSFRPRQVPQLDFLVKLIEPYQTPPPADPPLMEFASSRNQRKLWQARVAHIEKTSADCKKLAQALISEWPAPTLTAKHVVGSYLIDIPAAIDKVRPEWERIYNNHDFYIHLEAVQSILNQRHSDVKFQRPEFVSSDLIFQMQQPDYRLPNLSRDIMQMPLRKVDANISKRRIEPREEIQSRSSFRTRTKDRASQELEQIIQVFSQSESTIKKRYAGDLKESLTAFDTRSSQAAAVVHLSRNERSASQLQIVMQDNLAEIGSEVEKPSGLYSAKQISWLQQGQLWPAITIVTLLEQLRSTTKRSFGSGMKERLFRLALSVTDLQRRMRMQSYQRLHELARYEEERTNMGHSNWRPEDYPDWVLLEVESNLLIRETQVEVALAIIQPESRANSVLQLNMGQGKTSCIIPMAAVVLADSKNLVRVSVPKALLQQTAQLLHGRLGGLVGREISHVPFSRKTSTKEAHVKLFQKLHRDIQRKRGVMLCLPEHQMSFMLSGLQRVLDQQIPEASMMVRVQKWLQSCARDILDESDHTLAVKTQLIYPSGAQMTVDGHPHRWLVVEQILGLMDMHLYQLALSYPYSIEVVRRPHGGFPFIFFLRPDVEEEMINRLRNDVCQGARGIIPIDSVETADRVAIKEFLSSGKVRQSSLDRIGRLCPDRPHVRQTIYLLRGLFVHRILIMALKKRYGVQYGLHPLRDPVAVPFHAKGVPSEQSEFGHVDVAILLTALAFYYCGISISQTRQALEAVLKSDDPASEYDKWTEDENFPDYLRDWHSINADDSQQMTQIWSSVRFKVPVIDYFMNNFVFPPHAKQFKIRLQSNGWDIPLFSNADSGKYKNVSLSRSRGLTTGFSGTNDIKPLLPLTIKQDDLPSLSHTNAEVLTYLLQPRSKQYVVMADPQHKRISENSFLHMLRRHRIRILIDSGAQILEKSNRELAEAWLKVDGRTAAALYFEGDTPFILSKQGMKTPLLASPYADNLNEVLVYLDEAHTRGTDLKFGQDARAALTLGLGQTKDHTVQAAMRLRQLGTTQSVVFFAPPEVNQSIRDLCGTRDSEWLSSYDVIRWLINNTCDGIEQLQPLYHSQGTDFCNRMQAAEDFPDFLNDDEHRTSFIGAIKHKERQTLQQLYGPQSRSKQDTSLKTVPKIAGFVKELESRKKTFQDTGQAVHASALQEVEQERETEIEVEAVRQVKKPLSYIPHKFPGLHRDLETFARTARIPAGSDTFIHILKALARTALGRKYKVNREISSTSSQLFVSTEFERTVKLIIESANDNFMRPVQWILYAKSPEAAIIVTPEEAEFLIKIIQDMEKGNQASPTRLLTYAAPVTRRMMHFNKLKFYAMPQLPQDWQPPGWLTTELGFFAGRLYFDWSEYHSICELLGIDVSKPGMEEGNSSEASAADSTAEVASSDPNHQPFGKNYKGLTPKPYTFTQEYLAARRCGQDFTHTPMGFLCSGKPLSEDSPFFRSAQATRRTNGLVPVGTTQDDVEEEGVEETMDLGNYDPSAEIQDDEDHITIEYDESEMHPVAGPDSDEGTTDVQSSETNRKRRHRTNTK